jgi:glycosyltransferase involved in cell wall biosynthesis
MILLTAPCRQCLVDNGWTKETHVVPNFISTVDLPTEIKPVKARKRILYLGRMDPKKGIFEILEVARRMGEEEFVFVGNFESDMERERFTQQLEEVPNATWLGPVYSGEKYRLIADSKFLLLPTKRDEFPMILIESSILGCVPLVNPIGSVGEIIKDGFNGLYIDPADLDGIIDTINKYKDSGDVQRLADNGIEFARANFTSEAVRGKLLAIVG